MPHTRVARLPFPLQARFTRQNWLLSGGGMLLNGAVAATAAYVLGLALESVLHVPKDGV